MEAERPFGELGSALKAAREAAGLTQVQAASRLKTRQAQLSLYETGQREAPLTFVRAAEAAYGRPILAVPSIERTVERPTRVREVSPPYGSQEIARAQSRVMADAARRLSAIAAELLQEASRVIDR